MRPKFYAFDFTWDDINLVVGSWLPIIKFYYLFDYDVPDVIYGI